MHFRKVCLIIILISSCIFFNSLPSNSEPDEMILVRLISLAGFKKPIEYLTIYQNGTVRLFIQDDKAGRYESVIVSKKQIDQLVNLLKQTKITDKNFLKGRNYFGIDAEAIFIEIYFNDEKYYLGSWHPFLECKENIVVNQIGPRILENNETREEYLKRNASPEYNKFRKVWEQCYDLLDNYYLELTGKHIDLNIVNPNIFKVKEW